MYKNKEERIELISEMRSTHALQEQDMNRKKVQKQDIQAAQFDQRRDISRDDLVDSILQTLEGEAMGDMLDYLSKELIRLQEERRIAAFAMLAERQRRLREAEESGLRQVEERRRREQDELFKQVRSNGFYFWSNLILFSLDAKNDAKYSRYIFRRCYSRKYIRYGK